jgi:hypothetical protein
VTSVRLRIDELVLHGIDVPNAHRLGPAVAAELTRLVRERGLPAGLVPGGSPPDGSLPDGLDAGSPDAQRSSPTVRLTTGLGAEAVGTRLAAAIYAGLRR